jgi:hypothetical protein
VKLFQEKHQHNNPAASPLIQSRPRVIKVKGTTKPWHTFGFLIQMVARLQIPQFAHLLLILTISITTTNISIPIASF